MSHEGEPMEEQGAGKAIAADRKPTPGMDKGASHKGENPLIPKDERGAGGGGPFQPKRADHDFHGGQSGAAYHGHGQLGEEEVEGQGNANSPSEDP